MKQHFLFAVDPSLSSSGWALFSLADGAPLAAGLLKPPGVSAGMPQRLLELQQSIDALFRRFRMGGGDYLVCEGPAPLVLNPSSAVKVERVRGIFETVARSHSVQVPGRLNPRTLQTELLGMSGKQAARGVVKASARSVAANIFGVHLERIPLYGLKREVQELPQDIVDALLIGVLAHSRIRTAVQGNRPVEELFLSKQRASEDPGVGRRSVRWRAVDVVRGADE